MSVDVDTLYRKYGPMVYRRCLNLLSAAALALAIAIAAPCWTETGDDSHAGFVPHSLLRAEAANGEAGNSFDESWGTNPAYNPSLAEPTYPAACCGVVDFRIKGETSRLFLYKKTPGEAVELSNGAIVRSGDTIQLAFSASQPLYGFLLSVDGNGRLTAHYPESGTSSAVLAAGKFTLLDSSYVLDDAPRFELFLLVSSRKSFELRKIEALVSGLKPGQDIVQSLNKLLGKDFRLSSIQVKKE